MEWFVGGGIASLFGVAGLLIWRILKLGMGQEAELLRPAYNRIDELERHINTIEKELRVEQARLGMATYLLHLHNIPIPWET